MYANVNLCYALDDKDKKIPLAVKFIRDEDFEEKIRIQKREYEITKALDHPNIVKSIEFFKNS